MKRADDQNQLQDPLDEQRKLWIDTMNHLRHDWLNDLQLIMGYTQMKKYDKLAACVDMLKQRLTEEGRASKLGEPELVELLFTYRTRPLPYRFELSIEGSVDVAACLPSGAEVCSAVREALETFERAARVSERGAENVLYTSFRAGQADVVISLRYTGAYSAPELEHGGSIIAKRLRHLGIRSAVTSELSEGTANLSMRFPLRA
jgi:stage 0 sporulation protein B (sporulation initiation phosphotransferase)